MTLQPHRKMIHFDGANISGRRKYDVLTFCEIIFGGPTGGLRSQVSGIRYQVSGLGSRVSGLRSQVRSLNPPRPVNKERLRVEIRDFTPALYICIYIYII